MKDRPPKWGFVELEIRNPVPKLNEADREWVLNDLLSGTVFRIPEPKVADETLRIGPLPLADYPMIFAHRKALEGLFELC